MVKIAIIGGTGIYSLLKGAEKVKVHTPYGAPSGEIAIGKLNGVEVAFLPRHGYNHSIPPHKINYRANIWALHSLGVERVVAIQAVGSLREELYPGMMVFSDQFINFTRRREDTFFDGPKVCHISVAEPFCPELREIAVETAEHLKLPYASTATYITIEGPRFSTKAESKMYRSWGADIIGMTLYPEVVLARELGMCYLSVAMITDYDVWKEKPVDAMEVIKTMKENEEKVKRFLKELIPRIPEKRSCNCHKSLENACL